MAPAFSSNGCSACAFVAEIASRYKDDGARVIQDTCGVTIMLPGINDTATLDHASKLCGQAAYREHGQKHASRHDVMPPATGGSFPVSLHGGQHPHDSPDPAGR